MTQYQRITGKVFGGNATATGSDPQIAQFGSALANTFVGTTDPATIQSLPAWGQGWIGAVTPETQFPPLPEMTGAMKVLSYQICSILQQGLSTWDSGTIYYTGNFCSKNGNVYVSLSDENQGNDPATDTINWVIPYDGAWTSKFLQLANQVSLNDANNTGLIYSLAEYLPDDGNDYEVYFTYIAETDSTSGHYVQVDIASLDYSLSMTVDRVITRTSATNQSAGVCVFPISASRNILLQRNRYWNGKIIFNCNAYRRLGKNI